VPFIVFNESRLLLTIHNEVPPGKYHFEFKSPVGKAIISGRSLSVVGRKIDGGKIIFANHNWDTARLQTAIARFIIENGYGYPTRLSPSRGKPGSVTDIWRGLERGRLHVSMEIWLPDQLEFWNEAILNGSIIQLGKSMDDQWQSAFVVPTYVIKGDPQRSIAPSAPDLRQVTDLRRYSAVFATSASQKKAVLWNCPVKWKCSHITQAQVKAYGLDDVIVVQNPPSAEALFRSLEDAYASGDAWLGYVWGPSTKLAITLDLTRLKEPPFTADCWERKQCGYGRSHVMIAIHPSLVDRAPDVIHMLRLWEFNVTTSAIALSYLAKTGGRFEDAARMFLENQEAVWGQWVPTDVAEKVQAALNGL
jgi:glycine betaine/proline transport system substrate-binding protein